MNLETEGRISFVVTFIQRFVTQSKLSLIFTETLLFSQKLACFSNNLHDACQNADGNSKFNVTKLNPWKLSFWKQSVMAKDEIKVSVILANKSKFKAENFIIPIPFTITTLFYYLDYFLLYSCFFLLRRLFQDI